MEENNKDKNTGVRLYLFNGMFLNHFSSGYTCRITKTLEHTLNFNEEELIVKFEKVKR